MSTGCTVSFTTGEGDSLPPSVPLEVGQTMAIFELDAPVATSFVIRGTVPLPKGTWPTADGTIPAAVVDYDGSVVAAQVETVSRYPAASDGADVIEVIARVHRDPAVSPGTRVQYEVSYSPHAAPADPGAVDMAELHSGATSIPASLGNLLQNPTNLRFVSTDVFGNEYTELPLAGDNLKRHRYGETMTQLRSFDVMQPAPAVAGATGTLPHLFGIHSYLAVQKDEPVLLLDVRVSNGFDGHDLTTTDDDPLGQVYFEDFELEVPSGWVVLQDGTDPFVAAPYSQGGKLRYPLVKPIGDGTMHVIPSQGQFHRRLAIAPVADTAKAQALLDQAGLAFNIEATDPDSGLPMLSWFNPGTGRYFPQTHRLPSLEHMGLDNLRATLTAEFDELRTHVENGTDTAGYPFEYGRMGWAHPLGIQYGGMTGGVGIHLWQGVRTAAAASTDGYRRLQDVHRAQSDRMPVTIYNTTGETTSIDDWVQEGTDYTYVSFYYYNGHRNGGDDVFGDGLAPTFQVDHVVAQGLQPAYEADLLGFQAHDIQHLGRYTRAPKALAWLGNDALAKDDLQRQAQIFHLEYHEHYNSFWKHIQNTGLLADMLDTAATPGVGFDFGRGEGWGLDAVVAAYALSQDEAWRTKTRAWLAKTTETVNTGQADCSGIIQSVYSSKWLGGSYRIRQSIEGAIVENALRGMRERVFDGGVSPSHKAMLDDILHDSYYGMISGLAWDPAENGPWSHMAVGLQSAPLTPFCLPGDLPPDGQDGYTDNFQIWSSVAYAYELTKNPLFLTGLQRLTADSDFTAALEAGGTDNIFNRAAAIAMAQEL